MKKLVDILAIDDEAVIIEAISKLCMANGWSVDTVLSGSAALDKITKTNYRLIICDIMMPEIDGFQILNLFQEKGLQTPLIVTTGYSTMENAVKSLRSGAVDFLPKPFSMEELISSVSRGLRFGELRDIKQNQEQKNHATQKHIIQGPAHYRRLGYSSWMLLEDDGVAKVGATDLFIKLLKPITRIVLLETDTDMVQGSQCLQLECIDQLTHSLAAPISGKIIQCNTLLLDTLKLLEKDPYSDGWIYRIIPSDWEYESKNLVEFHPHCP